MEEKLVKDTFYKFLSPTLASSVALSILSMTDLVIAGHFVGEKSLTAISLALPVIIFVQIVSALLGTGGAIMFSSRQGEGDLEECSRIFTLSMTGAFCCGLAAAILGVLFLKPLVSLLGAVGIEDFKMASDYIGILLAGMPFMILSPVMMTYLRNDSSQGYSLFCVLVCALLNVILSPVLCVKFGMGIRGIALGTVLSQMTACVLAGRRLFTRRRYYGLVRRFFSLRLLVSVLKPGSSVALIFFCQVLLTVAINRILAAAGGVAVYTVVKYLINFLYALFDGVTGAAQPMFGIYYGEREKNNLHITLKYAFRSIMVMALVMFVLMEFGGGVFCTLFGVESAQVKQDAILAMRIMGFFCFGGAAVTHLNSLYRCIGKEKLSLLLALFDNMVFPMAGILFFVYGYGMGTAGVFAGLAAAPFCSLALWGVLCRPWKNGILLIRGDAFADEAGYHKIVPAVPDEVSRIMDQVEEYCFAMEISPKKQYYINLSIEELILNVVGLAGADRKKKKSSREYYADIRISPRADGTIYLRIRDNLTEWVPMALDINDMGMLAEMDESSGVNELGIGIIKRIAKDYSYKRTIGFNNFSAIF